MKKFVSLLLCILPLVCFGDDTNFLQTLFNAGNCTLIAGHAYTVSGALTATHTVNMNSASITTTLSSGPVIILSCGGSINGGTLKGTWNYLTPYNPGGGSGIKITCDNASVTFMTITQFSAYGIVCSSAVNGPTITNNNLNKIGYIAFSYIPNATKTGGIFNNNVVDRSMIPAANIHQPAIAIRGSNTVRTDTISGWTVSYNSVLMPLNPTDFSAECIDMWGAKNSTISNNTASGGSIGISSAFSSNVTTIRNKLTFQNQEGIEIHDNKNCSSNYDNANETAAQQGAVLLDGAVGCNHITLNNDTLTNPASSAVHAYFNTTYLYLNGCVLSSHHTGVDAQQSNFIFSTNTSIDCGSFSGTSGYYLDTSPGNLTIQGGSITHCTNAVFANYSNGTPAVVDNIYGYCVTLTGVTTQFGSAFSGGAHYGVNKGFITNCLIGVHVKAIILP